DLLLPEAVRVTADLRETAGAELLILAVPTQALREVASGVSPWLEVDVPVLIAAKGLEMGTSLRVSQVVAEAVPKGADSRVAVLSGPNLAAELVRELPTVSVVAALDPVLARRLQQTLSCPFFRVYTNADVAGVELGGAL